MDDRCLNIAVLIANSVAAIAAVIAAIIAVVVYRKSANLQKKAINYSLLDSKLQLWKYVEHDKNQIKALFAKILDGRDWQIEKFKLLFGDKLFAEFYAIETERETIQKEETEIDAIERNAFSMNYGSGQNSDESIFDAITKIRKERKKVLEDTATNDDWIAFKKLSTELFQSDQYYTKVFELGERKKALNERDKAFIKIVENEIISSIQDEKEKKKRKKTNQS